MTWSTDWPVVAVDRRLTLLEPGGEGVVELDLGTRDPIRMIGWSSSS